MRELEFLLPAMAGLLLGSLAAQAGDEVCDDSKRATGMAGCAALADRHRPSSRNSAYPFDADVSFQTYAEEMRKRIANTRQDLADWPGIDVLEVNAPFELAPDAANCPGGPKGGALLVHGLTDSPYLMRDIGAGLARRCLLVRAIVLPGHGTVPGDLLDIQYGEWVKAVAAGIRMLRSTDGPLIVVGFSTGAAAALYSQVDAAGAHPADALVLVSPAVKPKSELAFMANWHRVFRLLKTNENYAPKRWLEVATDRDYAKYESFPKDAGDQIHELGNEIRRIGCENVDIPVFMALSNDDNTVSVDAARACFAEIPSRAKRLLLYAKSAAGVEPADGVTVRAIADPGSGVLDFSHTALPVAPSNPHYGAQGDYRNCMHYLGDTSKWTACKNEPQVMRGENSEENVDRHVLVRLTFNPDFDGMMADVNHFLDGVVRTRP